MTRELYRPVFLLVIKQSDFLFAKDIFSLILSAWFKWSELLVRHTIGKVNRISEICRPKLRLCTTPVRKTQEKAQKVSIIRPVNTRKHPSKEIPTNMQEPEDTHPGTRHRTASHKAMASHPPTHDMTQKSVTADSPKAHKKASKRTLQKSQQTHPKMVPTCLLFEDITRQRNSEFDTLHATDPAQKPLLQSSMMT